MRSPPGTSPAPVWPALSLRINNIASEQRAVRPAQVEQHAVFPGNRDDQHFSDGGCALAEIDHGGALFCNDISRLDHFFPALGFSGQKFGKLRAIAGDHIEAYVVELFCCIRRIDCGRDFAFQFGAHIRGQSFWRCSALPGINDEIG